MKLLGRQIKFGDPDLVDVVIFDDTGSNFLRAVLSESRSICVFRQNPEDLWIGFGVGLKFFQCLRHFRFKEAAVHQRGVLVGILRQLRLIYCGACLEAMRPKAVITFIDNSPTFGWLSKNCRNYPHIAIQNGSRLSYSSVNDPAYHAQHLFCFGAHEKNLFPKLGYQVEHFHPVGSLVASLHFERRYENVADKYDLLVVSSWRGNIGFQQDVKDTMYSMERMDRLLARYIRTQGIKAAVILRAEKNSPHWIMPELGVSEEQYYKNIYGDCIDVIETDFSVRNIFPLMQQSRVIVSCLSTSLLEGFGIGKKILYCNFTGTNLYHSDFDPAIVTDRPDWDDFSIRLSSLLSQPIPDYQKSHGEMMNYFMSFPGNSSTRDSIAIGIDEIINNQ
jgi:hypothetical protein